MNTPPHIANLGRAVDEAWRMYEAACDDPTIEPDMLREMGKTAEILTGMFHQEYRNPLNWLEAVELPITNMVAQHNQSVSILGENAS